MHTNPGSIRHLKAAFLGILSKFEQHAQFTFRYRPRPHDPEDAIAETVAICSKWLRHLVAPGSDPAQFPTEPANYAVGRKMRSAPVQPGTI